MPLLLAVDPAAGLSKGASLVGLALFDMDTQTPIELGTMTAEDAESTANRDLFLGRASRLVVEDQWLGHNIQTLMALVEAREAWRRRAIDAFQIPVYKMLPTEWMSKAQRGWTLGAKKNMGEIRFYFENRFNMRLGKKSNDMICAGCMGAVYLDLLKVGRV